MNRRPRSPRDAARALLDRRQAPTSPRAATSESAADKVVASVIGAWLRVERDVSIKAPSPWLRPGPHRHRSLVSRRRYGRRPPRYHARPPRLQGKRRARRRSRRGMESHCAMNSLSIWLKGAHRSITCVRCSTSSKPAASSQRRSSRPRSESRVSGGVPSDIICGAPGPTS